jgi:hypothetical protein
MGVYLLISLNTARRHGNEALSALRIEDYKNFLRLHVHPGGLTVYPVGLRKVPRAWKVAEDRKPGEPWFVPACGALEPELIEEPITIPIAPQHRRRGQPTADAAVAVACERSASEPQEPQKLSEPHELGEPQELSEPQEPQELSEPQEPQEPSEPQEPRALHEPREPRSRPPAAGATADAGAPDP